MPGELPVTPLTPLHEVSQGPTTLISISKVAVALARDLHHTLSLEDFQDVQSAATAATEAIDEFRDFCDRRHEYLEDSLFAKRAVNELLADLKITYRHYNPLFSLSNDRQSRNFRKACAELKARGKVEASFKQLRKRFNMCLERLTVLAADNYDPQMGISFQESVLRALSTAYRQNSSRLPHALRLKLIDSDSLLTDKSFISSYTNVNSITTLHIKPDVYIIIKQLEELLSNISDTTEGTNERHSLPLTWPTFSNVNLDSLPISRYIIAGAQEVSDLIIVTPASSLFPTQKVALKLVDLANALLTFEAFQEAVAIGSWAVKLFRTLLSSADELTSLHLSLSLRDLSRFFVELDKLDEAQGVIEDALQMSRPLFTTSQDLEVRAQIVSILTAYSRVASLKKEDNRALELAEEGVRLFESLIHQQHPGNSLPNLGLIQTEEEWAKILAVFPDSSICNYSHALYRLWQALRTQGRLIEGAVTLIRALVTMNFVSRYRVDGELDSYQGHMLYELSLEDIRGLTRSPQMALVYASRAVEIFRGLIEKNPRKFAQDLCNALSEEATILQLLERSEDALCARKEAVVVAEAFVYEKAQQAVYLDNLADCYRSLERFNEAASTRKQATKAYHVAHNGISLDEAKAYSKLAQDLRGADLFEEAIKAGETALKQCRALASVHPANVEYSRIIGETLTDLTFMLFFARQTKQAFSRGQEGLKFYKRLIALDPSTLQNYLRCRAVNVLISLLSEISYKKKSFGRMAEVLRLSRKLVRLFPALAESPSPSIVFHALRIQGMVLSKADRLRDALSCIQTALDWYDKTPAKEASQAVQHMEFLLDLRRLLSEQGRMEEALSTIDRAIKVGEPFSDNSNVAAKMASAMQYRASTFLSMGKLDELAMASEEALAWARKPAVKKGDILVAGLLQQSVALKYQGRYDEAIAVADEARATLDEALEGCTGNIVTEATNGRMCLVIYIPVCHQQLSETLANAGRDPEALEAAQRAVDAALDLRGKYVMLPWVLVQANYVDVLYNLAYRLAENGEFIRALEILVECREFYKKRSKARKGSLRQLAVVMRLEARLYCATGRHVEGVAAGRKLNRLLKRLRSQNSTLARSVLAELDCESRLPSSDKLMSKLGLECQHQDEDQATPGMVSRLAGKFKSLMHT